MCPERTLRRKNVENITASTITSDEILEQRSELKSAERKLKQAKNRVSRSETKVALLRQRLAEAKKQYRLENTRQTQRAFDTATTRLQTARHEYDKTMSEYREIKLIARDLASLVKSLEKKEIAKQEAVARFLKEWERNYDRKMSMKKRTVQKRKRLIKS